MKYSKEKLFWKIEAKEKCFFLEEYDETKDCYSFVKDMIDKKCHQIAITSDIMLDYIERIASIGNIYVDKIEMMEEDDELIQTIGELVSRCSSNRGNFVELVKRLRYLDEESSVDIKRVYLHEEKEGKQILGYIQVNGVVGISEYNSCMVDALLQCVRECLSE